MATSFRPQIKPSVLIWARESMGLSQEEIAKACDCQTAEVANWEMGSSAPTLVQLRALANKCRRPLAFLFLPEPPNIPQPPPEYRTLHSVAAKQPSYNTTLAIRTAQYVQEITARLNTALAEQEKLSLPHLAPTDDPEKTGLDFRALLNVTVEDQRNWRSDFQAVREWRTRIEHHAVTTLQLPFPLEDGRGFSLYDEYSSVIVINSKDIPRARCFTLFHEAAHLCLRRSGICRTDLLYEKSNGHIQNIELFCNRFAAAALIPSGDSEVESLLQACVTGGRVDHDRIKELAKILRVSRSVVLRKLMSLDRLSIDQIQAIEASWPTLIAGKMGGGRNTPFRACLNQRGHRFVSTVLEAFERDYISYSEASDYLGLKVKHFDSLRQAVGGL